MTAIEVTTRYVTTVEDLPAAWAFVMARIDAVGPTPSVQIKPRRFISVGAMQDAMDGGEEGEWESCFEVVVEGMVEEPTA